jgi:hypothetical protein
MHFDTTKSIVAAKVKTTLNNIRYGFTPDTYNWLVKI